MRRVITLILILFLFSCSKGKRTGAICNDGWKSSATGSGACSHHGGVKYWLYEKDEQFFQIKIRYKASINNIYIKNKTIPPTRRIKQNKTTKGP